MSKVLTFDDGSIYVKRTGRWGRVNVSKDPFLLPDSAANEVAYIPIADAPIRTNNKGSTIKIDLSVFDYIDKAAGHTQAASNWMRTPYMLWCNRPYVGDTLGSTLASGADPSPVVECITGSGNLLRVIGETETHYEIWALPTSEDLSRYDPALFNPYNYPWIFWQALARTRDGKLQRVGNKLTVYHLNIRKPQNRHFIHKSCLTLLPEYEYQFVGNDVYGILDNQRTQISV
jgi:hypothetical protein